MVIVRNSKIRKHRCFFHGCNPSLIGSSRTISIPPTMHIMSVMSMQQQPNLLSRRMKLLVISYPRNHNSLIRYPSSSNIVSENCCLDQTTKCIISHYFLHHQNRVASCKAPFSWTWNVWWYWVSRAWHTHSMSWLSFWWLNEITRNHRVHTVEQATIEVRNLEKDMVPIRVKSSLRKKQWTPLGVGENNTVNSSTKGNATRIQKRNGVPFLKVYSLLLLQSENFDRVPPNSPKRNNTVLRSQKNEVFLNHSRVCWYVSSKWSKEFHLTIIHDIPRPFTFTQQ